MSQPRVTFRAIPREGQRNESVRRVLLLQAFLTGTEVSTSNSSGRRSTGSVLHPSQRVLLAEHHKLDTVWSISRFDRRRVPGGSRHRNETIWSSPVVQPSPTAEGSSAIRDLQEGTCAVALELLPRLDRVREAELFLRLAREVDAFATLNYSKSKRISAVDVERHLRSKGGLAPVTTSPSATTERCFFRTNTFVPWTPWKP